MSTSLCLLEALKWLGSYFLARSRGRRSKRSREGQEDPLLRWELLLYGACGDRCCALPKTGQKTGVQLFLVGVLEFVSVESVGSSVLQAYRNGVLSTKLANWAT